MKMMKIREKAENKMKECVRHFFQAVNNVRWKLEVFSMMIVTAPMTVYAADAESAWNDTMDAIQPWVTRIGILLLVFGGVEFAISQSTEDAAQKTRSGRFMIAGAIVVALSTQLFPMLSA